MKNENPKVYVGTWFKYNNGNIGGKWIDITKFATYADFIAECKKIHSDEKDPEFMVQDYECFPDGFSCKDFLYEEDFNEILAVKSAENNDFQIIDYSDKAIAVIGDTKRIKDQLKSLGGRFNPKLSCGCGWVFSKTKLQEVKEALNLDFIEKHNENENIEDKKEIWEECKRRLEKRWGKDTRMFKYCLGEISDLMLSDDNVIISLKKRKIETSFCWSDEGPDYEAYKHIHSEQRLLEEYFVNENLSYYNKIITELETRTNKYGGTLIPVYYEYEGISDEIYASLLSHVIEDEEDTRTKKHIHRMSDNDIKKAIHILKKEKEKFEKRLKTYLKKYGTSKLKTWTYWADR